MTDARSGSPIGAADQSVMKSIAESGPVAALVGAVSTLLCCLPWGFAATGALGGLGAVASSYQPWFVGASILSLAWGTFQLLRARRACGTRRLPSAIALAFSATIIVMVLFYPQRLAGILADWLP
jgi:hypothetical protein